MRTLLTLLVVSMPQMADDSVGVPGSEIRFVPKIQQTQGDKTIDLKITGTALRTKYTVRIYGMASYVQANAAVTTAQELADLDAPKLLHLRMERKATGGDFVDAFRTAIGAERAKKEFAVEFTKLSDAVASANANKGDDVIIRYLPGEGTRIRIGETVEVTITGKDFGHALWSTFLGPNTIDEDMKKGLVSQLK